MKAKFPLHRVVQREPRYHQPYPNEEPKNIVYYVTERLDCGHTLAFLFLEEAEPLIAKYRRCIECENGRRPARGHEAKVHKAKARYCPSLRRRHKNVGAASGPGASSLPGPFLSSPGRVCALLLLESLLLLVEQTIDFFVEF